MLKRTAGESQADDTIAADRAIVISAQPASQEVSTGAPATFSVTTLLKVHLVDLSVLSGKFLVMAVLTSPIFLVVNQLDSVDHINIKVVDSLVRNYILLALQVQWLTTSIVLFSLPLVNWRCNLYCCYTDFLMI